jgi:PncC family amidohydrolase
MVYLLGSTPTIAPYAQEYMIYLMPCVPFLISSLVVNNQLRFQGSAFYGMIGITCGALLNVALDPLFIFGLNMGVAGAALATSISQMVSAVILFMGTLRGGNIRIKLSAFTPTGTMFGHVLRGGVIAYHEDVKRDVLGVPQALLDEHGAVSAPVAQTMAEGVRRITGADLAVSVTGVAGPDRDDRGNEVGTVYLAVSSAQGTVVENRHYGSRPRQTIREMAAFTAFSLLLQHLEENQPTE